jgi:cellulose biosynthesis protein BcsQ
VKTLAICSVKGGVGKTSSAVILAHLAARSGARTLLWDLDPQGAASYCFRVRTRVKGGARRLVRRKREAAGAIRGTDFDLLDLLPADFSYRNLDRLLDRTRRPEKWLRRTLRPLKRSYDYVFLDCAPGLSLVSKAVFRAADALLVPTIPTTLSLRALRQLRQVVEKMPPRHAPPVLPFFSLVDRRKTLHVQIFEDSGPEDGFLRGWIPYNSLVEQMAPRRAPLHAFAARSAPGQAYDRLWSEIRLRLSRGHRLLVPAEVPGGPAVREQLA